MSPDKTYEFIQQHASEFNNSLKVVEMLLTHHAEVNIIGSNRLTALGNSVTEENPLLVRKLLAHGANDDISVKSKGNATPLNLAAQNRNVTIAR